VIDPESTEGMVAKIRGIVEKPEAENAPSDFAVVGRYILHPSVLKTLETQAPGSGGEIQLTDALAQQVKSPGLYGFRFSGRRFDCGDKRGFLTANIYFGLR
ncbi:MAG: UTP--glucose-1-phosphate uridylyltransferase, partial [Burkholderiaceae bacterium]|nr:UTP--glucose-1-phosphate uridylyltransferase [Burkholderiaceae bacterium]